MKTLKTFSLALAMTAIPAISPIAQDSRAVYITIDSDALTFTENTFKSRLEEIETKDGISIVKIDEEALPWLSLLMHKNFNRCGGFMLHEDVQDAEELLYSQDGAQLFAKNNTFANYAIDQDSLIKPMIAEVKADNISATITKLSSFKNRYYKGEFGKQSATWIKDTWTALVKNRADAKVEFFAHSQWDQPSVILTLQGASDDVIIVAGHQDSINGSFGGATSTAPGADDNASGIATVTEIIRVLADSSYQPQKTIKFMAYAAEEVGLLGSKEISTQFKKNKVNVIGVMQLDMTNFQGTKELDIVMMRDYTNDDQNNFIGAIIDRYVPGVKWGFDKCGYGCSDHASWHAQGYPASMPFEARKNDMNRNIHTARDLMSVSGGNASHASKFAKMGIGYLVELDR
ncbi:MAG: M20/M25/M40 family metallo-hydrolase [Bacteriovoracaceae bacterium]|nr:M20/M25/M40 family metallo-hydrolase [Bacteriovoracaceae bacterium]